MLDSLRFVQGAVAKKDFVATLTHFRIRGGSIMGYNGMMALCCPIDLDLDVCPKATPFVKAIQTCKDTIAIHSTPTGRLSIKSGSFKAFIDCTSETFPEVVPEGQVIELGEGSKILETLKALSPFIAEDASRPWARGILFRGQSAFATNNVALIEKWLGYNFPVVINIPKAAVAELLRIGEEPISLQMSDTSMTFHFPGNRWLRTQSYPVDWPDLSRILDTPANPSAVPASLFEQIADLAPFVDELGAIHLHDNAITTGVHDTDGATVVIEGLAGAVGTYNIKQFMLLDGVATSFDLTTYPAPCLFYGDGVRGAVVGMRKSQTKEPDNG